MSAFNCSQKTAEWLKLGGQDDLNRIQLMGKVNDIGKQCKGYFCYAGNTDGLPDALTVSLKADCASKGIQMGSPNPWTSQPPPLETIATKPEKKAIKWVPIAIAGATALTLVLVLVVVMS
jgi:hypothetical protein